MASTAAALLGRVLAVRWIVRAPVGLYRLRLGVVFGQRMLLLAHIGRNSGVRRYAVLEVVDRPAADQYVIVSGFGERSQWYRNVVANPNVLVSVGTRCNVPARATPMSAEATEATLERYARRHPRPWRILRASMSAALDAPDLQLPMVRLDLES
ncbi:nitroreductase family deazaflavin-dependent oxidoreductase [Mycobacterium sp. URHB0021]